MSGALFELPPVAPLTIPQNLATSVGAISYTAHRPKHPQRCDDCMMVALEANRTGEPAPLARTARFVRKQDTLRLVLCAEHKQHREQAEAHAAAAAEKARTIVA